MNAKLGRALAVILSLFALIYFGYQIYQFFYSPYKTEIAEMYQYTDQVELEGVMLKDEELIEENYDGIIQYEFPNAQKVVKDAAIATVYQSESDLSLHLQAQRLDEKIAVLKELQESNTVSGSDLQNIHSAVEREQSSLLYSIQRGQYSDLSGTSSDFLKQLLKQEKALNPELSFEDELSSLEEERKALAAPEGTVVKSPVSGYFTSLLDGYEAVITKDSLTELSVDGVKELLNNTEPTEPKEIVGKMIGSTDWQFAALIATKDLEQLSEGKKVDLIFSGNETNKIEAKVEKINKNPDEETSAILLSSGIMNEKIIDLRKEKPVIFFGSGKGLRVSRDAVRMKDGKTGVYINSGRVVRFRQIDIVYTADDYVISRVSDDKDFLQLYDEVIVEGKDGLYDDMPM